MAIFLIALSAVISFISTPRIQNYNTSNVFMIIFMIMSCVSLVSSSLSGGEGGVYFTIIFLFTALSVNTIASRIAFRSVAQASVTAYALIIATIVIFDRENLLSSLDVTNPLKWSLRYSPFEMHPNLAALFFGMGAILAACSLVLGLLPRLIAAFVLGASCVIMLATSSRAAMLALAVTFIITFFVTFHTLSRTQRVIVILGVMTLGMAALFLLPQLLDYFSAQFELDSNTRGLDSGGSGRTDLWKLGIDYLFRDSRALVVGLGLRQANADLIGFSTESSYITIALESGAPLMIVYVGFLVRAVISVRRAVKETASGDALTIFSVLTFIMIQSIFNRYLLAVGNTASLICMFATFSSTQFLRSRQHAQGHRFTAPKSGSKRIS
jgi:hypothetical protein